MSRVKKNAPPPTLSTIAEATGLSQSHLSRVLRGERMPSWEAACVLADYAGGTLDALRTFIESSSSAGISDLMRTIRRSQDSAR